MTHEQAIDTLAAERYLLGELSSTDADAFESHYFDCQLCAADVEDGMALKDGMGGASVARFPTRNFALPLAAAAAVAIAVALWQQFGVISPLKRDMRQAHVIASYPLTDVRAPQNVVVDGRSAFTLDFDIPPEQPSPSYTCTIADSAGTARYTVSVTAEQARHNVQLYVPGGVLIRGNYTLRITGAGAAPIVTYEFKVR